MLSEEENEVKKVLIMLISVAIVLSTVVLPISADSTIANDISFADVDMNTEVGKDIYKMAKAGIIVGDGNGYFRPNDPIRRSEVVKIVNAICEYTEKDETGFSDVTEKHWYYEYVLVAKKAGYIKGYEDGTFRGDWHVTREQACAILCRTQNIYDLPFDYEIKDPVSEWAKEYVQKVLSNLLVTVEEGNIFRAQQNITRAEFCDMFASFVEIKEPEPEKPETGDGSGTGGGNGSGSGSGDSSGDVVDPDPGDDPVDPGDDDPVVDIEAENAEMVSHLKAVSADIDKNKSHFPIPEPRKLILTIQKCIDKVIEDAKTNRVDADYVRTIYKEDIDEAKGYYNTIMADSQTKARFQEALAKLNSDTLMWLADQFGVSK